MPATAKRRWFQFSLRTLLVFVTLCAIACSWLAVKMQQAQKQREAVAAIRGLGGRVDHDYLINEEGELRENPGPQTPRWLLRLFGIDLFSSVAAVDQAGMTDANAKTLELFPRIRRLSIYGTLTDAGLQHLRRLTHLRALSLRATRVTDAGFENLKGLRELDDLELADTQITDATLEQLRELRSLKVLVLGNTRISDAGLDHLKTLTQLRELYLGYTNITDTGLAALKRLRQLKYLSLRHTHTTKQGVEELQRSLPECKISTR
jgi:Leucine-rich repeat (LRR) protein